MKQYDTFFAQATTDRICLQKYSTLQLKPHEKPLTRVLHRVSRQNGSPRRIAILKLAKGIAQSEYEHGAFYASPALCDGKDSALCRG